MSLSQSRSFPSLQSRVDVLLKMSRIDGSRDHGGNTWSLQHGGEHVPEGDLAVLCGSGVEGALDEDGFAQMVGFFDDGEVCSVADAEGDHDGVHKFYCTETSLDGHGADADGADMAAILHLMECLQNGRLIENRQVVCRAVNHYKVQF